MTESPFFHNCGLKRRNNIALFEEVRTSGIKMDSFQFYCKPTRMCPSTAKMLGGCDSSREKKKAQTWKTDDTAIS